MTSGMSEFNEVFFDDVFVPDDVVIGPIDGGWTVAGPRWATGISVGGEGGKALALPLGVPRSRCIDASPGAGRLGRHRPLEAADALNEPAPGCARSRRRSGAEAPSPAALTENIAEAAAIIYRPRRRVYSRPARSVDGDFALMVCLRDGHRLQAALSEDQRNQIGEKAHPRLLATRDQRPPSPFFAEKREQERSLQIRCPPVSAAGHRPQVERMVRHWRRRHCSRLISGNSSPHRPLVSPPALTSTVVPSLRDGDRDVSSTEVTLIPSPSTPTRAAAPAVRLLHQTNKQLGASTNCSWCWSSRCGCRSDRRHRDGHPDRRRWSRNRPNLPRR
jgi:hypothetical protein